jgi:outer membrane protein assembly factor BamB
VAGSGSNVLGTWTQAGALVVAADTGVASYDRATGRALWRTAPPPLGGAPSAFCGASPTASGGMVALGVGALSTPGTHECHTLTVLDLATGSLGWSHDIPSAAQLAVAVRASFGHTSLMAQGIVTDIAGQTVVASWSGVEAGFSLTDGTPRWSAIAGPGSDVLGYSVRDLAVAGPTAYLVVETVYPGALTLLSVDAATGRTLATTPLTPAVTGLQKPDRGAIVATSPLTILVSELLGDAPNLLVFDPGLQGPHAIPAGPQRGPSAGGHSLAVSPHGRNVSARRQVGVMVAGGLLIAATSPVDAPPANPLVAIDTATGGRRWSLSVPQVDMIAPVGIDGPALVAVGTAQVGHGDPVVVRADLASGRLLSAKTVAVGGTPIGGPLVFFEFRRADGRIYGVNWGQTIAGGGDAPAVVAFG